MTDNSNDLHPPFIQADMERSIPRRWKIALIITAVIAGISIYPGKWLSMQPVFAQVFAPRSWWIMLSLIGFIISGIVFVVRWRRRLPRRVASLFLLITLVASFANVSVGWGKGLRTDPLSTVATPEKGYFGTEITLMAFNTYRNESSPQDIARTALKAGADIIMLSEVDNRTPRVVAKLMEDAGHPMQVLDSRKDYAVPVREASVTSDGQKVTRTKAVTRETDDNGTAQNHTALLVSIYFGTYEVAPQLTPQMPLGAVVARPVSYDANFLYLPTLVSAHTVPPYPTSTATWRENVTSLMDLCHGQLGGNLIMGGNFNATPWQGGLMDTGKCQNALSETASGSVGTWPSALPKALGIPLDHLYVSYSRWQVLASTLVTIPGSDHRALFAKITNTSQ